jgi:hypothetical protein
MISSSRARPFHPIGVLLFFLGAVTFHVTAGVADEGHAVWRPGGHISVFVAIWWLLAVLAALDGIRTPGAARIFRGVVLLFSLGGLVLLFSA